MSQSTSAATAASVTNAETPAAHSALSFDAQALRRAKLHSLVSRLAQESDAPADFDLEQIAAAVKILEELVSIEKARLTRTVRSFADSSFPGPDVLFPDAISPLPIPGEPQ